MPYVFLNTTVGTFSRHVRGVGVARIARAEGTILFGTSFSMPPNRYDLSAHNETPYDGGDDAGGDGNRAHEHPRKGSHRVRGKHEREDVGPAEPAGDTE